MTPDAVIFDLFGTLVDNFSFQKHLEMLDEMANVLSVPPEDFMSMWLITFDERVTGTYKNPKANIEYICQKLGVKPDNDKIKKAAKIRWEFTKRSLKPRSEAVITMKKLKQKGCKIGLITDCSGEVPYLWNELPFAKLVDVPVFSCLTGVKKPDPRIYKLACKRLKVNPKKCLYVGDGSSQELSGASEIGMKSIKIKVPDEDETDVFRINEDNWYGPKISSISDVLTYLKEPTEDK
jgi:putative hydrolase of the HAD superfamily